MNTVNLGGFTQRGGKLIKNLDLRNYIAVLLTKNITSMYFQEAKALS
jgi:hypothetical protein